MGSKHTDKRCCLSNGLLKAPSISSSLSDSSSNNLSSRSPKSKSPGVVDRADGGSDVYCIAGVDSKSSKSNKELVCSAVAADFAIDG